jgi:hypothetical protein
VWLELLSNVEDQGCACGWGTWERCYRCDQTRKAAGFERLARRPTEREKTVINGMAGGALWGVSKEDTMLRRRAGEQAWTASRRMNAAYDVAGYPPVPTRLCRRLCNDYLMLWYDPLFELRDLMLKASFEQLNRPKEKSLAVRAFPELGQTPVLSGGVQVQAGVREYMQHVVAKDHSSAVAFYNRLTDKFALHIRKNIRSSFPNTKCDFKNPASC